MIKKGFAALLVLLCIAAAAHACFSRAEEKRRERELFQSVEAYISQAYSIECTITDCQFSHYDYGITGGLYMYTFTCVDADGTAFQTTYRSYIDLSAATMNDLDVQFPPAKEASS